MDAENGPATEQVAELPADLVDMGEVPATEPEKTDPEPVEATPEQKGAAGVAEAEGEGHTIAYKVGDSEPITLKLPPRLRASVVGRAGVLRDDDVAGALKLLQAVVGNDQYEQVMDKWDEADLSVDDDELFASAVGDLLNNSLAAYGLTPGESEASSDS